MQRVIGKLKSENIRHGNEDAIPFYNYLICIKVDRLLARRDIITLLSGVPLSIKKIDCWLEAQTMNVCTCNYSNGALLE